MSIDIELTQIHGCDGITAPKMPNHERKTSNQKPQLVVEKWVLKRVVCFPLENLGPMMGNQGIPTQKTSSTKVNSSTSPTRQNVLTKSHRLNNHGVTNCGSLSTRCFAKVT